MFFNHLRGLFSERMRAVVPACCEVCGHWPSTPAGQAVCGACRLEFTSNGLRCPTCALTLDTRRGLTPSGAVGGPESGPPLCGACTLNPPVLSHCTAAVDYAYPWDKLLHRFKFQGEVAWSHFFANAMLQAPGADARLLQTDWVLPIPLSLERLGERGYNQSWELVKAFTRNHRHKARSDWLLKLADTPIQHELDHKERQRNLKDAFATASHAQIALANSTVLLVDDIMTTGATLHAAALTLRRAGVAQVNAMVFARTPAPQP